MKKVESRFTFETDYTDAEGRTQKAEVKLKINYGAGSYSIEPSYGKDSFGFIDASHNWKMWKAVLSCINNAIDFANIELGIVKTMAG